MSVVCVWGGGVCSWSCSSFRTHPIICFHLPPCSSFSLLLPQLSPTMPGLQAYLASDARDVLPQILGEEEGDVGFKELGGRPAALAASCRLLWCWWCCQRQLGPLLTPELPLLLLRQRGGAACCSRCPRASYWRHGGFLVAGLLRLVHYAQ